MIMPVLHRVLRPNPRQIGRIGRGRVFNAPTLPNNRGFRLIARQPHVSGERVSARIITRKVGEPSIVATTATAILNRSLRLDPKVAHIVVFRHRKKVVSVIESTTRRAIGIVEGWYAASEVWESVADIGQSFLHRWPLIHPAVPAIACRHVGIAARHSGRGGPRPAATDAHGIWPFLVNVPTHVVDREEVLTGYPLIDESGVIEIAREKQSMDMLKHVIGNE